MFAKVLKLFDASKPTQADLPDWMKRPMVLPKWANLAKRHSDKVSVCIEVDTDGYIKEWLPLLGVQKVDQYWLEVAYQCAKLDVQMALVGTEHDPRFSGMPAQFNFSKAPEWALTRHPHGKGADAATKGKEARGHYIRIRGRMPF